MDRHGGVLHHLYRRGAVALHDGQQVEVTQALEHGLQGLGQDFMEEVLQVVAAEAALGLASIHRAQAGLLATVGLVGAFLGALFWGTISDYIGRRTSFAATIGIFSVFTGLVATSWNVLSLSIFRFISNFGLGGEVPVALTFNSIPHVVMLATPLDLVDMGYGFTFTEALVSAPQQIRGDCRRTVEMDDKFKKVVAYTVIGGVTCGVFLLPLSGLFMSVMYPTINSKGISCVPKGDHGAAAGGCDEAG